MNVVRNLALGTLGFVLVTALVLGIFLSEEKRMNAETKAQEGQSTARGAQLYDAYCAGCHGDRGQGIPGIYPPLNVEDMWSGREDIAFYGSLEDYVKLNIAAGHPGQRMPSWSEEYGGPLRDDQIYSLTQFVLNWQGPQPPGVRQPGVEVAPTEPVVEATPEGPVEPAGGGDPARGEEVFVQYCASCHGPGAEGGALGPTLISADLGGQPDEFFQETITNGRAGTAMPPWGGILSSQDIADVIAHVRSKQP
jgi:mono/diheme cytochrome c family protein